MKLGGQKHDAAQLHAITLNQLIMNVIIVVVIFSDSHPGSANHGTKQFFLKQKRVMKTFEFLSELKNDLLILVGGGHAVELKYHGAVKLASKLPGVSVRTVRGI